MVNKTLNRNESLGIVKMNSERDSLVNNSKSIKYERRHSRACF